MIERLATPSGGRAFFTENADACVSTRSPSLLDELSNQYLLGHASTNSKRDDTWRRIKVDVDGHHDAFGLRQGDRAVAAEIGQAGQVGLVGAGRVVG